MSNALTIVMGYRNRDLDRVERCLVSLAAQTRKDFVVHLVDYGSDTPMASALAALAGRFPFVTHVYTDTRGWAWNRSRALNTGLRLATTDHVLTTDVDMIFGPTFVEAVLAAQDGHRAVHCAAYWLPASFRDWARVAEQARILPRGSHAHLGVCQCMPTAVVREIRGFDEAYARWGLEDADLDRQLTLAGLRPVWVEDHAALFHQWHPVANHQTGNLITDAAWLEMMRHYVSSPRRPVRNPAGWGELVPKDARAVYRFVDPDTRRLRGSPAADVFADDPADIDSLSRLGEALAALPSGQALAIRGADFPRQSAWKDRAIRCANALLAAAGVSLRCGYPVNRLHPLVDALAERGDGYCEDHFFGLAEPVGATVLLKR